MNRKEIAAVDKALNNREITLIQAFCRIAGLNYRRDGLFPCYGEALGVKEDDKHAFVVHINNWRHYIHVVVKSRMLPEWGPYKNYLSWSSDRTWKTRTVLSYKNYKVIGKKVRQYIENYKPGKIKTDFEETWRTNCQVMESIVLLQLEVPKDILTMRQSYDGYYANIYCTDNCEGFSLQYLKKRNMFRLTCTVNFREHKVKSHFKRAMEFLEDAPWDIEQVNLNSNRLYLFTDPIYHPVQIGELMQQVKQSKLGRYCIANFMKDKL